MTNNAELKNIPGIFVLMKGFEGIVYGTVRYDMENQLFLNYGNSVTAEIR